MELMLLDKKLRPLGVLDGYSKCTWKRSYWNTGSFSLETDGGFFPLLRQAAYVYRPEVKETAMIQALSYQQNEKGQVSVSASGDRLEGLLARWVIRQQTDLTGTPEELCRELVRLCCISDPGRELPGLSLGPALGGGEPVTMQYRGENLLAQLQKLLKEQELSQRLAFDFDSGGMVYQVWQGKDRTGGQSQLPPVVFSAGWENLLSDQYQWDDRNHANVAYVQGADRTKVNAQGESYTLPGPIVEVDQAGEEDRREVWVNASSLSWTKDTAADGTAIEYSQGEYQSLLEQEGREALAQAQRVQAVKSAVDPRSNQRYRMDWDLGDKVTYVNQAAGVSLDKRITEVVEISDSREESLGVTFGEEYELNLLKVIHKEAKKR